CSKFGELIPRTGLTTFKLLNIFLTSTENVRLYFCPELSPPNPPPRPTATGPPCPPPGPPGPRPNVPPPIPPPPAALADSFFWPKPNVLLKRRLNENLPGPVAQFIGTSVSALGSLQSKLALRMSAAFASADWNCANVGRSLKMESLLTSCPNVTLKGDPELAITNGLSRNCFGMVMLPPRKTRWRTSNPARP